MISTLKTTKDNITNEGLFPLQKTVAEYFAGIGLVRMGLENAGWQTIFANDHSASKYEMYSASFADAEQHYYLDDIFNLNADQIPNTLLATASFPCIDLSVAGKQDGLNGAHSSAFWGFIKILDNQHSRRPPIILLENVAGWITSNKGKDFRVTLQALNSLGYACDIVTLDAIHFTPQSRPRVFVIGYQTNQPNQDVFQLLRRPSSILTKSLLHAVEKNFDLVWHTHNTQAPPTRSNLGLADIVEDLPINDGRWWSEYEIERHLTMMNDSHRLRINNLVNQERLSYRTMYRRVRNGEQRAEIRKGDTAGCLRTARGGSSKQMIIQAGMGNLRMRHMTPREYARLQGVSDNFPIPSNVNQALNGFGDAVCVPVITWLGANILNPLATQYFKEIEGVHQ